MIKTKAAYDAAVESLQKLLDKRDAQRKAEERAHILEGLIIASDNIEEVVQIIKSSKSYEEILRYVAEGSDTGEEVEE